MTIIPLLVGAIQEGLPLGSTFALSFERHETTRLTSQIENGQPCYLKQTHLLSPHGLPQALLLFGSPATSQEEARGFALSPRDEFAFLAVPL